jgi:serralysin
MFGAVTETTANTGTGINNTEALIGLRRWTYPLVSYSFTDNFSNDYESGYPDYSSHSSSFQTLNATQKNATQNWVRAYNNISNINLAEYAGLYDRDATIRIAMSSVPKTGQTSDLVNNTVASGDIFFNIKDYNTPVIGEYSYRSFGHELGHALGLKHPHETDGVRNVIMNADRDSMEFSIMSYRSYIGGSIDGLTNEPWGYAQSLMIYDISAIQQEYGAYFGSNAGNTIYTFSTATGEMFIDGVGQGTPGANRIFRTIWDGNGYDTYDFSNYSTNLFIDLNPGGWSDLDVGGNFQRADLDVFSSDHYARGHVFNALQYNGDTRSLIENVNGGSGNDRIIGNSTENVIYSGAGDDFVNGGDGLDIIYLGEGNDSTSTSSSGDDQFYGEAGDDTITGWNGNETYDGGSGNDTLYGYGGNDIMRGGTGNDYIKGDDGNDTINGGAGNDTIYGGSDNDTVDGGDGDDVIYLGAGNDTVDISSFGNDKFYGEAGDDYINGYSGNQ